MTLSLLAGAIAAATAPAPAVAQQATLEEVVVTARRRDESFQDVPVTITAFSEQDIRDAGIERPQDFISLTPNVTLVETQNQGTSFITVRGISQARNSEPSVAVMVDGVLMSNPAQFTQELFDVQQIEVLKGAQGAVYGRNAIGGAIVITTREPGDDPEATFRLGYDSGPGAKAQIMGNGPLGDSDTLSYHAALSYYDTDGWIENPYLGEEADPFKDTSARLRLLWEPSDRLSADARLYYSKVETQALFFNIVGFPSAVPLDVNDTSLPVRVNNAGVNDRDLGQLSFKVDYDLDAATFTSITSFDQIEEILTGDQYDFLPIPESANVTVFGLGDDWAQSQYLDVDTWSQEFRFTSDPDERLRWIAGAYMIGTDRYISTGNIVDRGLGAIPVYRTPRGNAPFDPSIYPDSFQTSFLADSQDNFAWALFGEIGYDLTDRLELSFALRYDEDTREQTTLSPQPFLDFWGLTGTTGEVREETWDEAQPRLTLRFQPSDSLTLFGGYSKGFRSGGFNQTGVGDAAAAAGIAGVGDLFDAEIAETLEFGLKSRLAEGRVNLNFSVFDTEAEGSYFFVFLPSTSTQNLGSLDQVDYQGFELDVSAALTDSLDVFFGYGYTDSEIKEAADPTQVGNQAPLVSEDTLNVGLQYRRPLGGTGLEIFLRTDYQRIGDTWWEPANVTVRNPVNLLDWRVGVEGETWSVVGWQRNFNDVRYNAEFSPGGFVFKAKPRRWGIDFTKRF
ncbi:MAG: TonB-dependent receptor [Gammaproteobacteria bacterium]|nr:TonB-dependent receptor [Gammaproteobacteria bacterium]